MPAAFDLSIEVLQGSWLCSIPPDLVSVAVCGELARLGGELVRLKVLADGSLQAGEWVASEESTDEEVLWLRGEEICYWRRQEEVDAACERAAARIQRRWRASHATGRRAELQRQLHRRATRESVLRALLALQDLWRSAGPPLPYFFAPAGDSESMDNVEPRLLASLVEQAASATAQAASVRASAGGALLLCSLQLRHLTAAELLLLARAPADAVSAHGLSALHLACRAGSLGLAQSLLRHRADLHARTGNGANALHAAGAGGCAALLRLLVARGLASDAAMSNGTTALHLAASEGHAAATQVLLLAQGGAVSTAPALDLAATRGHTAVVAALLEARAALDAASTHGTSALQGACDGGHAAVVELLLQRGARLEAAPSTLRAASAKGHVEVVRLLLQQGASAHAENALLVASALGHEAVAELLRGCGATLDDPQPKALVRALVEGRALLHQDGPESAALETACFSCQVELDAALESTCKGRQEELLGVLLHVPAPCAEAGSLDGDWLDGTGQEAAAIQDNTILWRGGLASVLSVRPDGSFSTSLEGWGELRAISGPKRRLIWSDGDVWQQRPVCAPSGAGTQQPGAILLARHGERLDDFLWAHHGELWIPTDDRPWDPPLTARGRLQALSLGYRIQRLVEQLGVAPPSRVFSSPFVRCFETAALAARVVGVGKVCVEPSICEGLSEEFWRSWAVLGADSSSGRPEGCGLGVSVSPSKLRPEARGTVAALVPPERLQAPWGAPADHDYLPLMTLAELDCSWGRWEQDDALEARMRGFYERVAKLGETVLLVSHAGPSQALLRAVGAPQAPCRYCCLHVLQPRRASVAERQEPRPAIGRNRAVGMAMELFECFDKDRDGFWSLREASQLIMATLGIKLPPRTFLSLKAAVADKDGDKIGHEEVVKGLSREDVVLLYTEPQLKRFFAAVMELRRDHAAVFPAKGGV